MGDAEDDDDLRASAEDVDPGRWRRFARRLLDRRELADDTRELLATLIATSDKAKSDLIRATGREVRHYLDGLRLKDDLLDLATNYRLEVRASFHLEPIAKALRDSDPAPEPPAKAASDAPKTRKEPEPER